MAERTTLNCLTAHEVRPAYLELHQNSGEPYDVLWKVSARGDNQRLGIYVEFPAGGPKSYSRGADFPDR